MQAIDQCAAESKGGKVPTLMDTVLSKTRSGSNAYGRSDGKPVMSRWSLISMCRSRSMLTASASSSAVSTGANWLPCADCGAVAAADPEGGSSPGVAPRGSGAGGASALPHSAAADATARRSKSIATHGATPPPRLPRGLDSAAAPFTDLPSVMRPLTTSACALPCVFYSSASLAVLRRGACALTALRGGRWQHQAGRTRSAVIAASTRPGLLTICARSCVR